MNDPAITAALDALIASTPPPVTVWGVRYLQQIVGVHADGTPFVDIPAGRIAWRDTETEARAWVSEVQDTGYPVELVRITGRVHPADDTATRGAR